MFNLSAYPRFYREEGFFDATACPNSCAENPRDTPQCEEWWKVHDAMASSTPSTVSKPTGQGGTRDTRRPESVVLLEEGTNEGNYEWKVSLSVMVCRCGINHNQKCFHLPPICYAKVVYFLYWV